jgi:isoleucyl-tRNA synthetase
VLHPVAYVLDSYVPGWDCHGLPIEVKVHEAAAKEKPSRKLEPAEVRRRARALAEAALEQQRRSFQSWGVVGDWAAPYRTMGMLRHWPLPLISPLQIPATRRSRSEC